MLYECIVLFCCSVSKRMKPMSVMAGTIVDCPTLHACRNAIGKITRQWLFHVYCLHKGIVSVLRKVLKHLLSVEHK